MRKMIIPILAILLTAFFLSGCNQKESTSTGTAFIGGDKGLTMSLIDGAPPDEILDDAQQPFAITIELKNEGETDIKEGDGYIELEGILPSNIGLLSSNDLRIYLPDISGKKLIRDEKVEGGTVHLGWNDLKYFAKVPSGKMDMPFKVKSCYKYSTRALTMLCVNPDLTDKEGICKVNEMKKVENSGAPVQVDTVQEFYNGADEDNYRYQLIMNIKNKGNGKVFEYEENNLNCDWSTGGLSKRNKVLVKVWPEVESSDITIKCFGNDFGSEDSGEILLVDNAEGKVFCTIRVPKELSTSAMQIPVNIELNYVYSESVEKTVKVVSLLR